MEPEIDSSSINRYRHLQFRHPGTTTSKGRLRILLRHASFAGRYWYKRVLVNHLLHTREPIYSLRRISLLPFMSSAEHNLQSKSGATPETQTTTRTQSTTQDNAPSTAPETHESTTNSADAPAPPPAGSEDLPEQLHAGKVGYGPNYHRGPVSNSWPSQ
jgi:hypothetical protein